MFNHFSLLLGCLAALVGLTLAPTVAFSAEPAHKVSKAFTSGNDGIRMQAIASLQQSPDLCVSLLDSLITVTKAEVEKTGPKDMVRPSVAELLSLIGTIENQEAEKLLIEMLNASHFGIVMIATDILGQNKTTNAIKPLIPRLGTEHFAKAHAILILEGRRHRGSFRAYRLVKDGHFGEMLTAPVLETQQ